MKVSELLKEMETEYFEITKGLAGDGVVATSIVRQYVMKKTGLKIEIKAFEEDA